MQVEFLTCTKEQLAQVTQVPRDRSTSPTSFALRTCTAPLSLEAFPGSTCLGENGVNGFLFDGGVNGSDFQDGLTTTSLTAS